MENAVLHLDKKESHVANAIWTLIDSASVGVKRFLLLKLNQQINVETVNSVKQRNKQEFIDYLDTIPMRGGSPVPADEDGKSALVDLKYSL